MVDTCRIALSGAVVLLVGWLVGPAPAASAHDDLLSSTPAAGAVVAGPVAAVSLIFIDRVAPEFVAVALSVDDQPWRQLPTRVDYNTVTADSPSRVSSLQRWRVAYRVVSADGHPVTGQIEFTVTPSPAPSGSAGNPDPDAAPRSEPSKSDTETAASRPDSRDDRSGSGRSLGGIVLAVAAPLVVLAVGGVGALLLGNRRSRIR